MRSCLASFSLVISFLFFKEEDIICKECQVFQRWCLKKFVLGDLSANQVNEHDIACEVVYLGDLSSAVPRNPLGALLVGVVAAVFALNTLETR